MIFISDNINLYFAIVVKINGLFRFRQRIMMPYCLGLEFAMGLGHEKQEWRRKERSSDWYDRTILQTFTEEQWIDNLRMTRQNS